MVAYLSTVFTILQTQPKRFLLKNNLLIQFSFTLTYTFKHTFKTETPPNNGGQVEQRVGRILRMISKIVM